MSSPRRAAGLLAAIVTLLAAAGTPAPGAGFAPVPGATYTGRIEDGTISMTVSSDGTLITAYAFNAVNGTNGKGGCIISGGGATPAWGGAPITGGAFTYSSPPSFALSGTFSGPQSVTGTLQVGVAGSSSGDGCSTGSLDWTATTSSSPASGAGTSGDADTADGSGAASNSGASSNSGPSAASGVGVGQGLPVGATKRTLLTVRVNLGRRSAAKLGGTLRSSHRACVAGRTVTLWDGRRRLAVDRTTRTGAFTFRMSGHRRDQPVRATVAVFSTREFTCSSASSEFIRS